MAVHFSIPEIFTLKRFYKFTKFTGNNQVKPQYFYNEKKKSKQTDISSMKAKVHKNKKLHLLSCNCYYVTELYSIVAARWEWISGTAQVKQWYGDNTSKL